jgi:hypothetical protein
MGGSGKRETVPYEFIYSAEVRAALATCGVAQDEQELHSTASVARWRAALDHLHGKCMGVAVLKMGWSPDLESLLTGRQQSNA